MDADEDNVAAISYSLAGSLGGISLILMGSFWLNALGVILLTHSLVISATKVFDGASTLLFCNSYLCMLLLLKIIGF